MIDFANVRVPSKSKRNTPFPMVSTDHEASRRLWIGDPVITNSIIDATFGHVPYRTFPECDI